MDHELNRSEPGRGLQNALTIDVEGFAESNRQSFDIPASYLDGDREATEVERNTHVLLDLLSELDVRATFFFVGTVADRLPGLVRETAGRGHEVGSHSFVHTRVFDLPPDEFRRGLAASKDRLEELTGNAVRGFRAPDFSITTDSLWALDTLLELGFQYDSSIYPTGLHDVYGIDHAPSVIHTLPNGLVEFPLATAEFAGRRIPFGGGGYFRLYPVRMTEALMRKQNALGRACMFYIHPYEVGPVIPRIRGLSPYRRFRHYYNCRGGGARLRKLLQRLRFTTAADVLVHERRLNGSERRRQGS
jgi:polysaccharide deacetylase family protein (PEP-CTERM system associated)